MQDDSYHPGTTLRVQTSQTVGNKNLKIHPETDFFIAMELLSPNRYTLHQSHHDIESAYWVLLWIVLRHTHCREIWLEKEGDELCKDIFQTLLGKVPWLMGDDELDIVDNAPLNALLKPLKRLVFSNVCQPRLEAAHLTHEVVLTAFDEALAMDGWPENGWIPCPLEGARTPTDDGPALATLPIEYREPKCHRLGRFADWPHPLDECRPEKRAKMSPPF